MRASFVPELITDTVDDCVLHAAAAAYLGRYRGQFRLHTGSDLKIFLTWCIGPGPLSASRGPGGHRTLRALPTRDPLLPAVNGVASAVRGGRLLPDLCHGSETRRLKTLADEAQIRTATVHPHMLRHTFVTTMLDARVSLRDVQIAARHADPRTTMRYDRARKNLDRHPNYILAAYMASGT
jgi:integrase